MTAFKMHKVTAMPGSPEPHSFYFVAPAGRPDYTEVYVTGTAGSTVKRIVNTVDVQAMIDTALASMGNIQVVADITARDALAPTTNMTVLVLDATADGTVASGAATYIYRVSNTSWTKISEAESLDISLSWTGISGRPTSAVVDIDDAVSKRHAHINMSELNKIGEDGNGDMTYNGNNISPRLTTTGW